MLGLGDIVVPGLALAMALRQDYYTAYAAGRAAARSRELSSAAHGMGTAEGGRVTAHHSPTALTHATAAIVKRSGWLTTLCGGCYYFPAAMVGYIVGLSAANLAVALMRMGQPALLYLVPCILGPLVVLAWWRGELAAWWGAGDAATVEGEGGEEGEGVPLTAGASRGMSSRFVNDATLVADMPLRQ